MPRVGWVVPAYVAAVSGVLIALQADDPTMARVGAVIPFAVLVVAMATAPRAAGWSFAAAGLVITALCPMAAVSRTGGTGGWLFVACIVLASIMVTIAMIRAGAWPTMRRHTWIVALLGVFAGLVAITSCTAIAGSLHVQRSHPRCIDTCWGDAVSFTLGTGALIELLAFTIVAVAFAARWIAGLGALTTVIAENVLPAYGEPRSSASYAATVVAWYIGALVVTRQWTRRPSPGRPG